MGVRPLHCVFGRRTKGRDQDIPAILEERTSTTRLLYLTFPAMVAPLRPAAPSATALVALTLLALALVPTHLLYAQAEAVVVVDQVQQFQPSVTYEAVDLPAPTAAPRLSDSSSTDVNSECLVEGTPGDRSSGEVVSRCGVQDGTVFGNEQQHRLQARQDPPASSSISIPQTAANGGLSMTQPAITAQATFYKIASENYITFGWTLTDVLVTPTALTINAYCSQNGYTYPVGPTSGIEGDATQFAWNPYEYEQSAGATPLAEASYTLRIFDERGYAAAPSAGYMSSYAGTVFALYRPQRYVALADGWTCTACSAALRSTHMHPAVLATAAAFLFGTMTVFLRLH